MMDRDELGGIFLEILDVHALLIVLITRWLKSFALTFVHVPHYNLIAI